MPGVISLFPLSYTPLALVLAWALKGFRSDGLWVVVVDVPHLIFSLPLALTPFLFLTWGTESERILYELCHHKTRKLIGNALSLFPLPTGSRPYNLFLVGREWGEGGIKERKGHYNSHGNSVRHR